MYWNQLHQEAATGSYSSGSVAAAAAAINAMKKSSGDEIVLYQKVSIGTGTGATNPWLQEFPDSISKATWDNYAMISMAKAKELLGLDLMHGTEKEINNYEYYPKNRLSKLQ